MLYASGISREKREIHYKDLAHTIMEAEVQDLKPASWRARRVHGVNSFLEASWRPPKEPMFQFKS